MYDRDMYDKVAHHYMRYFGYSYVSDSSERQRMGLNDAGGKTGLPTSVFTTEHMVWALSNIHNIN